MKGCSNDYKHFCQQTSVYCVVSLLPVQFPLSAILILPLKFIQRQSPDLHRKSLQGVIIALPAAPHHPCVRWSHIPPFVNAIGVAIVTRPPVVPESSTITVSTAAVIFIKGGKISAVVEHQTFTWKKHDMLSFDWSLTIVSCRVGLVSSMSFSASIAGVIHIHLTLTQPKMWDRYCCVVKQV